MLRMPVYKQALFFSRSVKELQKKRIGIWHNILYLNNIQVDYDDFRDRVKEDPSLIKNVEEVIMLDVQRSVHNMPGVDPQVLTNILKAYALFNKEIEYCQGMNFIAGFLLMVLRDEETAFKALVQLVERFNMA